jgi:hypothetical protein
MCPRLTSSNYAFFYEQATLTKKLCADLIVFATLILDCTAAMDVDDFAGDMLV